MDGKKSLNFCAYRQKNWISIDGLELNSKPFWILVSNRWAVQRNGRSAVRTRQGACWHSSLNCLTALTTIYLNIPHLFALFFKLSSLTNRVVCSQVAFITFEKHCTFSLVTIPAQIGATSWWNIASSIFPSINGCVCVYCLCMPSHVRISSDALLLFPKRSGENQ